MLSKVWSEITDPFPNFNGAAVEIWEGIDDLISDLEINVITYPCSIIWIHSQWKYRDK